MKRVLLIESRMRALVSAISFLSLVGLASSKPAEAQQSGPGPKTQLCGTITNPCRGLSVSTTFLPTTLPPEHGGYSYIVTVSNLTPTSASFQVSCRTLYSQWPCTSDLGTYTIAGNGGSQNITLPYATLGLGQFSQRIVAVNLDGGGAAAPTQGPSARDDDPLPDAAITYYTTSDSVGTGWLTVAGDPIGTFLNPAPGAYVSSNDTIRVNFWHPSGVNSATFKLYVYGSDVTSSAHVTSSSIYLVGVDLRQGQNFVSAYGCANNGRCDLIPAVSFIAIGTPNPPPSLSGWVLDSVLPLPVGEGGYSGTLPGALPLPPTNYRGCPVTVDAPEMTLYSPGSNLTQPANSRFPAGYIWIPTVSWDTTLEIVTYNHDYKPSDNITCANNYTYLQDTAYDWTFWTIPITPQTDSLWAVYPYGDRSPGAGHPASIIGGGSTVGHGGNLGSTSHTGGNGGGKGGGGGPSPFLQNAGAINPDSFEVWLNGTQIILHGVPQNSYVHLESTEPLTQRYLLSASAPAMHRYDVLNPTADNGGWNEIIASISDSTGHRTSIRTRFVQIKAPIIKDLALTRARDFSKVEQGECAAFGAFQCTGLMLTQTIPGFVTRDKDRSLHLVYRSNSQRAPTILPLQVHFSSLQATPDSFRIFATAAGSAIGDTLHYFGTTFYPGADVSRTTVWRFTTQDRIIGAQVSAPASGEATIRSVSAVIRALYGTSATHDNAYAQDIVQLYLTDTTSGHFGPGWALAEQSRLIFGQTFQGAPAAIWLDGDGSYEIFRQPVVNGPWVSPAGETAHLVDSTGAAPLPAAHVVYLDNGASIGYRMDGWQVYTADLVGNKTRFLYATATSSHLDSIADPSGIRYEFRYNTSGAGMNRVKDIVVHAPSGDTAKVASLNYNAAGQLSSVQIWRSSTQGDSTYFGYISSAAWGAFIDSVSDPRSTLGTPIVTVFGYDTALFLPVTQQRPPDRNGTLTALFRDYWRRAVPVASFGRHGQPQDGLVFPSQMRGTFVSFDNAATTYAADQYGGPTLVQLLSPPPINVADSGQVPNFVSLGGDDVRRITRDSVGRAIKIVHSPDSTAISDSVIFHFDRLGRVDTIIRNTLAFPVAAALDTVTFKYDSALVSGNAWCSRLRSMRDPMGGRDTIVYGASGAASCLPLTSIGVALDTTRFTYGSLVAGDIAGVRPVSVTDPAGVVRTMQYDTRTWNSAVSIRAAANDTSRVFYSAFGRADSTLDGVHTRTLLFYDLSGRVIATKTGRGSAAPTTVTHYNKSGLADTIRVFGANSADGGVDTIPVTTVQRTVYFYNLLGQVDSVIGSGGRRQYFTRDPNGAPLWEFTANGSYINRMYDWRGRLEYESPSAVSPYYSVNGDPFADAATLTAYNGLGLSQGTTLTEGQVHRFTYDNKGRQTSIRTRDIVAGDSLITRHYGYSRTNALIADTLAFMDGAKVVRGYRYNRRGQRTLEATTVSLLSGGTIAEPTDTLRYIYDDPTGRLTSMVDTVYDATSGKTGVGTVRWLYDKAVRDTLRGVLLGGSSTELQTHFQYDAAGRLSLIRSQTPGIWYQFGSPSYNAIDAILSAGEVVPCAGNTPTCTVSHSDGYTYDLPGTGRLLHSSNSDVDYYWTYDVFGNRLTENTANHIGGTCNGISTSLFGADNALLHTTDSTGPTCSRQHHYYSDGAGNRLFQGDSTITWGSYLGVQNVMSYTAKNQLFFSFSTTGQTGVYDYNWHWYDAAGRRVITLVDGGTSWDPLKSPVTSTGTRNYYIYDGNDVALTLVKQGSSWWVRARYLTGGLDQPLAGRFQNINTHVQENLALVTDREGTTLAAMLPSGAQETNAVYFSRNPWGSFYTTGQSGSISTQTGFAGASQPNASGGFVYLRNRWYDPQTGRFLTQDPIGLAGGVNLYSYAGNNPVSFDDPFGLCPLFVFCSVQYQSGVTPPSSLRVRVFLHVLALAEQRNVIVVSGNRSPEHNAAVNGASNSCHVRGCAADIRLEGETNAQTAKAVQGHSTMRSVLGIREIYEADPANGHTGTHVDTQTKLHDLYEPPQEKTKHPHYEPLKSEDMKSP